MTLLHDDRAALVESVRRLLADRCAEADVRRIMDSASGHDPGLWRALADVGVTGLTIAEAQGGLGLGAAELELVMEEAGAALLPAPLLSCAVAARLLADCNETLLLAGMAAGKTIAAVAFARASDWSAGDVRSVGDGLTGTLRFVPDAAAADLIVVACDHGIFTVGAGDVTITPLPTFDRTRRMADVTLDRASARRIGDASAANSALDLAVVALAGEQAGGARRMLEMTVAYAAERHQFGRAIGSFQAIKHMAADLLLESESAISAARDAAAKLDAGHGETDASIALAAFACADAFVKVTADGIQMHGGVAFTWDHPAHLYLRRARSGAQLFGDSSAWRNRYVTALERAA